jgi:hypothetical protein
VMTVTAQQPRNSSGVVRRARQRLAGWQLGRGISPAPDPA